MKLVPPTISAIGRAIRLKLMTAPPIAITSTNSETKNCTSEEDDSMRSARSVCLMISSYSAIWRSTIWVRCRSLVTLPSTWPSSWTALRQEASMALRRRWRSLVAARCSSRARSCALAIDSLIDPSTSATMGSPLASISATALTAFTQPGGVSGTALLWS